MFSTVVRPIVVVALLCAAPSLVAAQDTPETLTQQEWRCERQAARSSSDFSAAMTDCLVECEEASDTDPLRRCDRFFGFDLTTQFCIEKARAQPEIRMLRRCSAESCPECYLGGNCSTASRVLLDNAAFGSDLRVERILCDDSASPDGLNADEAKCRERLAGRTERFQSQMRRCFDACQKRRQAGRLTEEACRSEHLGTEIADARLENCVHRARIQLLRSCLDCNDSPECWVAQFPGDFCPELLEEQERQAQLSELSLFCVDKPRCGDGFHSPSEQCDFSVFPSGCAPNENCTSECGCEAIPICGDGQITGFETCDQSAAPNGCAPGESCFNCNTCAPDACDDVTTISPNGGTFFGSTTGSSSTSGFCGGSGPEAVFAWTPNASGVARIDTCGSSFDTVLYVRELSCDPFARQLACNDDSACGLDSQIQVSVQAGTTYYVFVDGFGSGSLGAYQLHVVPPTVYGSPQKAFLESSTVGLLD